MFAIPGLIALCAFIYLRPQEFVPALQGIPFLYLFVLLVALGFALDLKLGLTRLVPSPLLPWGVAAFAWSMLTMALMAPGALTSEGLLSFIALFLFATIAQSVQTLRALRTLAMSLLLLSLGLAAIGVHQNFAPTGCVKQDDVQPEVWLADGRSCETREDCTATALESGSRFRCERLGLFGTTSVEGRVRYRGIMEDPNELAMVLSLALPFAFIPFQARRSFSRLLLALGSLGAIGLCVIFTRSRSGQLAFLTVLAANLIRRLGWAGVGAAALLGAPVLMLGGRTDASADQSTMERLECWSKAIELFRGSPIVGVGKGQFVEHHWLTAHNSFLLTLAETGLPGLFLWTGLLYFAFKILVSILRADSPPGGRTTFLWANALFSSLCAFSVSAFFLSLTNHNVLWIYLGLVGGLASTAKALDPDWRLRFTRRDAAILLIADCALVAAVFIYTRIRGV